MTDLILHQQPQQQRQEQQPQPTSPLPPPPHQQHRQPQQQPQHKKPKRTKKGKQPSLPLTSSGELPPQEPGRCQFVVKQRYCKFQVRAGCKFCAHHSSGTQERRRVPCPLDPRHDVYEGALLLLLLLLLLFSSLQLSLACLKALLCCCR